MSEPFLAEVRIFAGNFAPRGWAYCDGQLLPVSQNTALFSLIGTTYGGDGRTTTALPDMNGRSPMHPGRGPGLTSRRLGQKVGSDTHTLSESQLPSHNHTYAASPFPGDTNAPSSSVVPARSQGANAYSTAAADVQMAGEAIANTGGSGAHENRQPFLELNFIIAISGQYPSRS